MSESGGLKTLVVIGNGPSLKGVDLHMFDGFDTIAMNAMYRHCYDIDWWPTYFCCFDHIVTDCHAVEFKKMTEDKNNPIKKFFFLKNLSDSDRLEFVEFNKGKYINFGNTGTNACQMGYSMGYNKLILIGIDCNYKENVPGGVDNPNGYIEIMETPEKNENYFIDNYQRKGDKVNPPNAHIYHKPAWEKLAEFAKENEIDVVNCSPISTLDCFRKSTLEKEIGK